jgi:hypothetical protein
LTWAWLLLQEALPHGGTLQKAANATKHWKVHDMGSGSSQIAVVPRAHAVSASTELPNSALQLKDTQHVLTRQETLERSAEKESLTHLEADALPKRSKVRPCNVGAEDSDFMSQLSSQTTMQCLQDAAICRFQSMVQSSEEMETSIEVLSSACLEAFLRQPIASSSNTSRPKDSASHTETISTSQQGSNAVGGLMSHNFDATPEGISGVKDRGGEGTSTGHSTNAVAVQRQALDTGLMGESGEALKAAFAALQQVEDVHRSDELMHFEFCGPFWELSEV